MNVTRFPGAFRLVPRMLAPPGSLAADAFADEKGAAGLFRSVGGGQADNGNGLSGPARIGADAFVSTSPHAEAKLHRILSGEGQFVTTGQQPGLFLGPLYTLYKTVTAIRVAERLEASTGRPTLAAFWVAADDHDWDEIGSCQVLADDETLTTFRLHAPEGRMGRSVGETVLPNSIIEDVQRLVTLTGARGPENGQASFLAAVTESYRPGQTMSGAFIEAMAQVFDNHDLVLLDSSSSSLREAGSELYGELIRNPADVLNAMASGKEAVRQAGYPIQLTPPEAGLQLFHDSGSGRHHVLVTPQGFSSGPTEEWSSGELAALLADKPESFTPAAALRPVLENWLLPVAATVLGPGEISYWAQLKPLFEALEVEMPTVVARDSWILIEARVDRLLGKLGVDADVVERDHGELRRQVIESGRPERVVRAMTALENELNTRFEELGLVSDSELPGLKSAVGKARHGMTRILDDLRRVVDRRVTERESTTMDQLQRVMVNLAPGGNSQERALGVSTFLAKHGPTLIDSLLGTAHVAGPQAQD